MKHLPPVFNIVKLTQAPMDPFTGRHVPPPPLPNKEEEWIVEEIIDSKVMNWKLQYLVNGSISA